MTFCLIANTKVPTLRIKFIDNHAALDNAIII